MGVLHRVSLLQYGYLRVPTLTTFFAYCTSCLAVIRRNLRAKPQFSGSLPRILGVSLLRRGADVARSQLFGYYYY
ncbi:hypothetical protein L209DRAFT_747076 [Thermothelomyces heterothallicus CBS 203.75]